MQKKTYYNRSNRSNEVNSLKECIEEMLDAYKLRGKINETHLITSWEKIMGKPIAGRTTSLFIKNKKLFVKLNSAPLKQELSMAKERIIEMLNKEVNAVVVEDVIFQ